MFSVFAGKIVENLTEVENYQWWHLHSSLCSPTGLRGLSFAESGRISWTQVSLAVPVPHVPHVLNWPLTQFDCYCCCLVAQSCPTLCDPIDCGPPGSSVHGILQARILEWVAISSSEDSVWCPTWILYSLHLIPVGSAVASKSPRHSVWTEWKGR